MVKTREGMTRQDEPPTRLSDPILALRSDYFFACEVMYEHLLEERSLFLSSADDAVSDRCLVYLSHWLSSLWVVAHGFRNVLKLRDRRLNDLIDLHFRELSEFRNATYHYHRSPDKHLAFYSNCDLHQVWAYDLHREFQRFFHDYEVHLASFYPDISAQEWQKR
jgi:hypothetical protein